MVLPGRLVHVPHQVRAVDGHPHGLLSHVPGSQLGAPLAPPGIGLGGAGLEDQQPGAPSPTGQQALEQASAGGGVHQAGEPGQAVEVARAAGGQASGDGLPADLAVESQRTPGQTGLGDTPGRGLEADQPGGAIESQGQARRGRAGQTADLGDAGHRRPGVEEHLGGVVGGEKAEGGPVGGQRRPLASPLAEPRQVDTARAGFATQPGDGLGALADFGKGQFFTKAGQGLGLPVVEEPPRLSLQIRKLHAANASRSVALLHHTGRPSLAGIAFGATMADVKRLLESLLADPRIGEHAVYQGLEPARQAAYGVPAGGLPSSSLVGMAALGVERLYSHQAEAAELAAKGENLLLATPTASGKTLAFLLALDRARQADPDARGLFLYPLKALARDQLATIQRFFAAADLTPEQAAAVYDGDTPQALRRRIRRLPPAVLVTNPDMLHLGIIPSHDAWAGFLSKLAWIAVDEAHVYRGVFGAHVHHVLRRLLRLARDYGADPRIVAGSATIGEPEAFIETLTGEPCRVVRESGAGAAARHVLFLRPDAVSPYTVATRVVARAVEAGHRTIAFTKARRITELMQRWLAEGFPQVARRVASYRSGYLPEERRRIEQRLFSGQLGGVISTSALEAGIDVGGLDVCVLVGYPGSLATAWQRIGRAGRGARRSLAVLVALPDALDHFVVRHPEHFFSGEFERVVLDPQNDTIADAHFQAAASERSLDVAAARTLGGEAGPERVLRLEQEGKLIRAHEEERWFSLRRRPQREIHLRSAGQTYRLLRAGDERLLGTLEEGRAWHEGHPGAIYLHGGQTWQVIDFDEEKREIHLESASVDYFTQVFARKETEILERGEERPLGPGRVVWGRLKVTTQVEGYSRRRIFGQEEISRHVLEAPPQVMETVGFWFEAPENLAGHLVGRDFHPVGALHAVEHAAIGLFPLLALCDRWDLGGISYAQHPQVGGPAVFVYDAWPGGVGLARAGFRRAQELFERTRTLVAECECEGGCPACVYSPKCGSGNHPLDKQGAVEVLDVMLGRSVIDPSRVADPTAALAAHRRVVHAGVRGGGALEVESCAAEAGEPPVPPAEAAPDGGGRLEDHPWPEGVPSLGELLGPDEGRWLFFDIETLRSAEDVGGWGKIDRMGCALAVCLDARSGELRSYFESDVSRLVDELLAADRVVGFNSERFDLTVLEGYEGSRVRGVCSLDLLAEIKQRVGRRFSLAHLAEQTLGASKTADGLQSLEWVKQGRYDLIEKYCRADVALTAALWAYGRHHGYLLCRSRDGHLGRVPVRW